MKLNEKQMRSLVIAFVLIIASLLVWIGFGAEIFTKSEVLIEKKDEILGTSYKEWQAKFILGLDYTIGFIALVISLFAVIIYKQKSK